MSEGADKCVNEHHLLVVSDYLYSFGDGVGVEINGGLEIVLTVVW